MAAATTTTTTSSTKVLYRTVLYRFVNARSIAFPAFLLQLPGGAVGVVAANAEGLLHQGLHLLRGGYVAETASWILFSCFSLHTYIYEYADLQELTR